MTTGSYMAGTIPKHNLLTPDYRWDSVRYEGKTVPGEPSAARHWTFRMYCGKIGTGKPASSGNRSGDLWEQADRRIASSCQWQRFHMIQLTNDSLRFYRADAAYYSGDCQDGGVGHSKAQHFFAGLRFDIFSTCRRRDCWNPPLCRLNSRLVVNRFLTETRCRYSTIRAQPQTVC